MIVTHVLQGPTAQKKGTHMKIIVQNVEEESIMTLKGPIRALRAKIALLGRIINTWGALIVPYVMKDSTARMKRTPIKIIVHNVKEESIMMILVNLHVEIALLGRLDSIHLLFRNLIVSHVMKEPTARKKRTPIKIIVQHVKEENITTKAVKLRAPIVKLEHIKKI
jgi:hypothetical protein